MYLCFLLPLCNICFSLNPVSKCHGLWAGKEKFYQPCFIEMSDWSLLAVFIWGNNTVLTHAYILLLFTESNVSKRKGLDGQKQWCWQFMTTKWLLRKSKFIYFCISKWNMYAYDAMIILFMQPLERERSEEIAKWDIKLPRTIRGMAPALTHYSFLISLACCLIRKSTWMRKLKWWNMQLDQ